MQWYEAEVRALERDVTGRVNGNRPPVFYGSSSIRLWTTLAEDLDPHIVNLGFGGSTLEACDHFFERLVPPVKPRSLLVYAGDNDLGDGRPVDHVVNSFRRLATRVEKLLGPIPFGYVSIKPSPARFGIIDRIRLVNDRIRDEISALEGGYFVDVFPAMLDTTARPRVELFADDGLHLSRAGYELWTRHLAAHRNRICID
jgi:lysophospholipase L1-like esterase